MTRQIKKGSLNVSVELYIIDDTDGKPELGVLWNTAGIDLNYRRDGAVVTSITEATLAALTTAHTDGGFLEIANGRYRLDIPDAAFATGVSQVTIGGTVTGMVVLPITIQLVDYDPDSTDLGLVLTNVNVGWVTASDIVTADASSSAQAAIADAVWDESTAGHVSSDTFGEQLKTDVDAILVDSAEIGLAGVGLTDLQLPSDGLDLVLIDGKKLPVAVEIIGAVVAGKISGAGTGIETFVGLDASTDRVVVTVDSSGNRTAITYS